MVKERPSAIDALLARHRIAPLTARGTHSRAAATGGRIATVNFAGRDRHAVVCVSIDGVLVTGPCPLDQSHARSIVQGFRDRHLLPDEPSFELMFADLLVRMSDAYVDSGAGGLDFETVHLHPASYHIGRVSVRSKEPLKIRRRLESDSHDRRAVYAHRHGDDINFPR